MLTNLHNPKPVAILGLGYLGLALAHILHQHGHSLLGARRSLAATPWPLNMQALDIGAATTHDWSAWAAYPVWLCLLPPSSSPHYITGIQHWLQQSQTYDVQHIIYSSSISVYGLVHGYCHESTPLQPQTDSAHKIMAVETAFSNSGIKHIDILRLGGLYSDQRHPIFSLQKKALNRGGAQPTNMVSQQQAVAALYHAITHPNGLRVRNIVAPQHPPKQQFYAAEALRLKVPAPQFDPQDQQSNGKIVYSTYTDFDTTFMGISPCLL